MPSVQVSQASHLRCVAADLEVMVCIPVQIYSNREMEDQLTKIRDVLSDDKHDWELRVAAVRATQRPGIGPFTRHRNTNNTHMSVMVSAAEEGPLSHAGWGGRV